MQIAVSSMFFHEYPCETIAESALAAGCDTLEFWLETPDFWFQGLPEDLLIHLQERYFPDDKILIHVPVLDLNPCSVNPLVAKVSVEQVVSAIECAARTQTGPVTIHPGRRTTKRLPGERDMNRLSAYLEAVSDVQKRTGVVVCMENMEKKINALLTTPAGMRQLLDENPWLACTFDISHALAGGLENALAFIDTCGDRIANVHLSGTEGAKRHVPVAGNPDIIKILETLADREYDGPLTFEFDDLNFSPPLSLEEKIAILKRESSWVRETLAF